MEKQAEALGLCVQHLKIVQKNGQLERRVATLEEALNSPYFVEVMHLIHTRRVEFGGIDVCDDDIEETALRGMSFQDKKSFIPVLCSLGYMVTEYFNPTSDAPFSVAWQPSPPGPEDEGTKDHLPTKRVFGDLRWHGPDTLERWKEARAAEGHFENEHGMMLHGVRSAVCVSESDLSRMAEETPRFRIR